ncbi:conserved hypothetical protein [Roseibium sp. TrichSKD4]|nr:conserved hypothetical protein [Roseibium sp. TrichSKD4]
MGIFAIRKGRRLAVNTQQSAAIAAGYDPALALIAARTFRAMKAGNSGAGSS